MKSTFNKYLIQENAPEEKKMKFLSNEVLYTIYESFDNIIKSKLYEWIKESLEKKRLKHQYGSFIHISLKFHSEIKNLLKNKNLKIKNKNIQNFLTPAFRFKNEEYFQPTIGIFLSSLCELAEENYLRLDFRHLPYMIDMFAVGNTKKIEVEGSVGRFAATKNNGTLYIHGSTSDYAGQLQGNTGTLLVAGSVGDKCGFCQRGGEIVVKENAGANCAELMLDGRIIIFKDAGPKAGFKMGFKLKSDYFISKYNPKLIIHGNTSSKLGEELQNGQIRVNGSINSLGDKICGGDIYQINNCIIRHGQKISNIANKV